MFKSQTAQDAQYSNKFEGFGRNCGNARAQKFGRHIMPWMRQFAGGAVNIPVNIEETDEAYYLHVYAAGLAKENFTLSVKEDVLSVAYKAAKNSSDNKFSHQEYTAGDFERLFQLNSNVITENIAAAYTDGVLKVTLPKNPEAAKPVQKVTIN